MNILNLFGITSAHAAGGLAHGGQGGFSSIFLMFGLLIFFMYFFIIRPQSKRAKAQRELLGNLKKGDEVLTTGGLLGKIEKISDHFIVLTIADSVKITVQKPAVSTVLPKGTMKSV